MFSGWPFGIRFPICVHLMFLERVSHVTSNPKLLGGKTKYRVGAKCFKSIFHELTCMSCGVTPLERWLKEKWVITTLKRLKKTRQCKKQCNNAVICFSEHLESSEGLSPLLWLAWQCVWYLCKLIFNPQKRTIQISLLSLLLITIQWEDYHCWGCEFFSLLIYCFDSSTKLSCLVHKDNYY